MGIADTLKSFFTKAKNTADAHSEDLDNAIEKGMNKAKDKLDPHMDKIDSAIDKAADKVDDVTKGKASGMIDKSANAAKDAVDKLGKKNP
jgi:ElaB/YqjD/DUF883 family membrane-anchored ribosome-binding protein